MIWVDRDFMSSYIRNYLLIILAMIWVLTKKAAARNKPTIGEIRTSIEEIMMKIYTTDNYW